MPILSDTDLDVVRGVARAYATAEQSVLTRVVATLADGVDAPDWELRSLARLQRLRAESVAELRETSRLAARVFEGQARTLYADGAARGLREIGDALEPVQVSSQQQRSAVSRLVRETMRGLDGAANQMLRAADDVYRAVIADVVTSVVARGTSRRTALSNAVSSFLSQGIPSFTDKSGRAWNIQSYSDMAVRTAFTSAQIQGHEDTLDASGLDLVIVQPGPRACDICDRWARLVLSRSGRTGKVYVTNELTGKNTSVTVDATLAEARAAGYQHPNCRCSLRAFIPGVTSKSDIVRPPWDQEGYELQQQQRGIERGIRKAKTQQATAITPDEKARASSRVAQQQQRMRDHLEQNPQLKRQGSREQLLGGDAGIAPEPFKPRIEPKPPTTPKTKPEKALQRKVDAQQKSTTRTQKQLADSADKLSTSPGTSSYDKVRRAEPIDLAKDRATLAVKINPGQKVSADYMNNCTHVVVAAEMRARGFDVIARPIGGAVGRVDSQIENDWRDVDGNMRKLKRLPVFSSAGKGGQAKAQKVIEAEAAGWPDGGRGVMVVEWGTGGGHIFNVAKADGKVVIVEAQATRTPDYMDSYLTRVKGNNVKMMRVDDLTPREGLLVDVVEERTKERMLEIASMNVLTNKARMLALEERIAVATARIDSDTIALDAARARVVKDFATATPEEIADSIRAYSDVRVLEKFLKEVTKSRGQSRTQLRALKSTGPTMR